MRYFRFIPLFLIFLAACAPEPSPPPEAGSITDSLPRGSDTSVPATLEPAPAFELPEGRLLVAVWSEPLNPYYIVHLPDLTAEPYEILNTEQGAGRIDSISPDGTFIVFTSVDLDGDPSDAALFVLNTITSDLVEIGQFSLANNPPTWTADGSLLEFDTYDDGFYLFDTQTNNLGHVSARSQYSDGSAISPDGDRIAYKGDCEETGCPDDLYIINTDGSGEQKLEDAMIQSIVWHPNGAQLYIVVRQPGHNLYLYDIDSGALTLIEEAIAYAGQAGLSPGGEFFAYAHSNDELRILKTEENSPLPYEVTGSIPVWSPDGRFMAYDDGAGGWYILDLQTGETITVEPPAGASLIAWLP